MTAPRVIVALSGGVDSSVAAALLKTQGYDVRGVTFQILPGQVGTVSRAQAVAQFLNIPHEVLDLSALYDRDIITPFCRAYQSGLTPNPCVDCNRLIKFGILLDYARTQGASHLATGHYVRTVFAQSHRLLKAADPTKDQSYFLYTLTQSRLEKVIFPLGGMLKTEVKQAAEYFGIAELVPQEESQDLCFIPDGNYASFVTARQPAVPGEITDTSGQALGSHRGLAYYTIGQRQGLGISSPVPLYVTKLDAISNQVIVGPKEALYRNRLTARGLNWIAGKAPTDLSGLTARVRLKSQEADANVALSGSTVEVTFPAPQWGIAPGQSLVLYRGEEVLGGGVII